MQPVAALSWHGISAPHADSDAKSFIFRIAQRDLNALIEPVENSRQLKLDDWQVTLPRCTDGNAYAKQRICAAGFEEKKRRIMA